MPSGVVLLTGPSLKIKLRSAMPSGMGAILLLIKQGSIESHPEMRTILKGSCGYLGSYGSSQRSKPCAHFRAGGLIVSGQKLENFLPGGTGAGALCSYNCTPSALLTAIRANHTHTSSQTMFPLWAASGLMWKTSAIRVDANIQVFGGVARVCIERRGAAASCLVCHGRCLPTSQCLLTERTQASL